MSEELVEKKCGKCGSVFMVPRSSKKRTCEKCKIEYRQKVAEECKKPVAKKTQKKYKSMKTIIKEINKYNEKNGTYISYGKYCGLIYMGKI